MRRRLSELAMPSRAMSSLAMLALALVPIAAQAKDKLPPDAFAASMPLPPPPPPANGSIFQGRGGKVNGGRELWDMIETERGYEGNSNMITATDEMMKNASRTF